MLKNFQMGLVFAAVLALFSTPLAFADTETCIGVLAPGEHQKVVVPQNETCTIYGDSVVLKNVKVKEGATLEVFGGVIEESINLKEGSSLFMFHGTVGKHVSGDQTDTVIIAEGSEVGRVNVSGGTGETAVVDSIIEGSINIEEQSDGFVFIKNNEVGNNVKVLNGDTEIVSSIKANTIGGNLVCKNNSPEPQADGFINTVSGQKKGQCTAELGF